MWELARGRSIEKHMSIWLHIEIDERVCGKDAGRTVSN